MEYAISIQTSERSEVMACAKYLSSLNDIFERTLLGRKTRFFQFDGTGMQRLEDGFSYFKEWAYELKKSGEFDSGVESKVFLSWQVHSKQMFCQTTIFYPHCTVDPH